MLDFKKGKTRSVQRKISRSRVGNQQQSQPTYGTGLKSNQATLVEGERSHHYAIPAPRMDSLLTANVSRVTFFQNISDTFMIRALSFIPTLLLSCFLQVKATRLVKTSLLIPTGL